MDQRLAHTRRSVLWRQGLLERTVTAEEAIRKVVVVQTQYSLSLYPALFARSSGTSHGQVERLLREERSLIKTWAHRHTVHTFHREDFAMILGAIGPSAYRRFLHWCDKRGRFGEHSYAEVADHVLRALASGPLQRTQLHQQVPAFSKDHHWGWGVDVMGLAYRGDLVFAEQGGARTAFARRDLWMGHLEPVAQAQQTLATRYLAGHSPATAADFLYWTGLRKADAGEALSLLKAASQDSLDGLPESSPRLLAKFDPLLMGWKSRALFLNPKVAGRVVRPAGQIEATVLLNDEIQGTWRLKRNGSRGVLRIAWFATPGKRALRAVEREAEALCAGWGLAAPVIEHCEDETA